MTLPTTAAALAAAATTLLATPGLVRWAARRGLLDAPGRRRVHETPVPRLGGVVVVLGTTAGLLAALALEPAALLTGAGPGSARVLLGLVAGGGIAFAAGLVDDLRGLGPVPKLAAQMAAALVAYELGFRVEHLSVGAGSVSLGWASLPLTVVWIVGVTNAYNLVDGMDGLAAGLGVIAFGVIAAAAGLLGHAGVVLVAAAVLGALVGFLRHNFSPARIFLGDSGSLFVGFVLAVLSVQGSMKSATAVIVAVPLFALFIPLLDTAVAIARRWIRGAPIMQADGRHIHHRLIHAGLSHRDAVLLLYLAGAGFAGLGILLGFAPPPHLATIAVIGGGASALVLVFGMRRLQYDEFLLAGKVLARGPRRVRQAVRERIVAEEVVRDIATATSLEEIQQILTRAAPELGLEDMTVGRPGENGAADDAFWQVEYPVRAGQNGDGPLKLKLIGAADDDRPLRNGVRAARAVSLAVRGRMYVLDAGGAEGAEGAEAQRGYPAFSA